MMKEGGIIVINEDTFKVRAGLEISKAGKCLCVSNNHLFAAGEQSIYLYCLD